MREVKSRDYIEAAEYLQKIDAAIELIIPDNTAFTVLTALRQLGYENLKKVERSEHVILTAAEGTKPEEITAQLARAEILFNPNKHRMSYALDGVAEPAKPAELEAFVRDNDENNDRLEALLSGAFGMTALRGIERAVGWRLYDETGAASRERLEWACRSLLCNAVSQRFDIRSRPVRRQVGELGSAASKGRA